ncbi:MAG: hypothetical protein RSB59_00265 [Clostridia bacterium]
MIDEVLKDIKDAEEKADLLQKEAYAKGEKIVLAAEFEAEKQKKSMVHDCKADFRLAAVNAEKKTALVRATILSDGEKAADLLISQKADEIEKSADKILKAFVGKYN